MEKFNIQEVSDFKLWDDIIEKTPQYTIFASSSYLSYANNKFKLFFVNKGIVTRAGICILLSDDEKDVVLNDLVIYGGIFFVPQYEQKEVKAKSERFEITDFLIKFLVNKFRNISLALSTKFEDLRAFLWHNYHLESQFKFTFDLRYTSILDISSLSKFNDEEETLAFKNLEILRQRNIRKARRENVITAIENSNDTIDIFLKYYEILIKSQGEDVLQSKLQNMRNIIINILDNKKGVMFVTRNSKGEILYITIFIFDKYRAYYLFGAGNPQAVEIYKGAICFWDAFIKLAQIFDIKELDLEGINSPQRGWYKLSFGGNITPYYEINYKG